MVGNRLPYEGTGTATTYTLRYGYGGGLYAIAGAIVLEDVTFEDNFAVYGGAMMINSSSASLEATRLSLYQNEAYIGVVYTHSSDVVVRSAIAQDNEDGYGVFFVNNGDVQIAHFTAAGNQTDADIHNRADRLILTDSILSENNDIGLYDEVRTASVSYTTFFGARGSNVRGGSTSLTADGNQEVNPGYESFSNNGDPSDDDLRLAEGSPCIDAGTPGATDADGSAADHGAYGGALGF